MSELLKIPSTCDRYLADHLSPLLNPKGEGYHSHNCVDTYNRYSLLYGFEVLNKRSVTGSTAF